MALQTSGAISLNQIHVEAGGGSGTQASINDSDIRGLIGKGSGAQMSFSEWYGASAVTVSTAYLNYTRYDPNAKLGAQWYVNEPYGSRANHPWWQAGLVQYENSSYGYTFRADGVFPASKDITISSVARWNPNINKIVISNNYNSNTITRTSGFLLENTNNGGYPPYNTLPECRMAIGPVTNGTSAPLPQRMGIPTSATNFRVYIRLEAP